MTGEALGFGDDTTVLDEAVLLTRPFVAGLGAPEAPQGTHSTYADIVSARQRAFPIGEMVTRPGIED